MRHQKKNYTGIKAFNILYALSIIIWFFLQTFSGDRWLWLYLVNIIGIYLFIPLFIQLITAFWTKSKTVWVSVIFVVLIWGNYFGTLFIPNAAPTNPRTTVTIMTSNVLATRRAPASFISSLINSNADVIAFQELNHTLIHAIEADLSEIYPYRILRIGTTFDGMGIISKYPFTTESHAYSSSWQVGLPQVVTINANGDEFRLINYHAQPPEISPNLFSKYNHIRNEQAQELLGLVKEGNLPTIVLGDLNATPQNDAYRIITTNLQDSWKEAGFGTGHTKTNPFGSFPPKWLARIDYIFHTPDMQAIHAEIGPWDGYSDHRPVLVEIGLK